MDDKIKVLEEFRKLHRFYLYSDYKISEVANRLRVSRRTVERWLSGKTKPKQEQIDQIWSYLQEKGSQT